MNYQSYLVPLAFFLAFGLGFDFGSSGSYTTVSTSPIVKRVLSIILWFPGGKCINGIWLADGVGKGVI